MINRPKSALERWKELRGEDSRPHHKNSSQVVLLPRNGVPATIPSRLKPTSAPATDDFSGDHPIEEVSVDHRRKDRP
jgi:hypothetical protein